MNRPLLPITYKGNPVLPEDFAGQLMAEKLDYAQLDPSVVAWRVGQDLLKLYPDDAGVAQNYEQDIEVILHTADEHFNKLEEFGINVPQPYERKIGTHPADSGVVIYTLAPEIIGTELSESFAITNPTIVREQMVNPLVGYYRWVLDSAQTHVVRDLAHMDQFVFGYSANDPNRVKKLWLVDLEPMMASLSYDATYTGIVGEDLPGLYGAANSLGDGQSAPRDLDALLEELDTLMEKFEHARISSDT